MWLYITTLYWINIVEDKSCSHKNFIIILGVLNFVENVPLKAALMSGKWTTLFCNEVLISQVIFWPCLYRSVLENEFNMTNKYIFYFCISFAD